MAYNFNDINNGDQVFFESKHQKKFDLYWSVERKIEPNTIVIKVDEMGVKESASIRITEVVLILKV